MILTEIKQNGSNNLLLPPDPRAEHLETAKKIQTYVNIQIEVIINDLERKPINPEGLSPAALQSILALAFEVAYTPICDHIKALLEETSSDAVKKTLSPR